MSTSPEIQVDTNSYQWIYCALVVIVMHIETSFQEGIRNYSQIFITQLLTCVNCLYTYIKMVNNPFKQSHYLSKLIDHLFNIKKQPFPLFWGSFASVTEETKLFISICHRINYLNNWILLSEMCRIFPQPLLDIKF